MKKDVIFKKEKHLKRIMSLLLTFAVIFSLAGCLVKNVAEENNSGVTPAAGITETGESDSAYVILVVDEANNPVPGVTVQFCTDSECMMEKTGEDGTAEFETETPGKYLYHILQVPEGFEEEETEYESHDSYGVEILQLKGKNQADSDWVSPQNLTGEEGKQADARKEEEDWGEIYFETLDLEGNSISCEDLFADNKVTMINLWGTWCGYCVEELPELEELNKEFQEKGGGIIGICEDATDSTGVAIAKAQLEKAGVTYPNVAAPDNFYELFGVSVYPATFFVDSKGNLLTEEPVMGANIEAYKILMEEALDSME